MELEFFATVAVVSGFAVTIVQQILKSKIVPMSFANKYPVPTNIVLSVIASVVALYTQNALSVSSWLEIAATCGTVAVVAAVTYNQLLANWSELKETEGQ